MAKIIILGGNYFVLPLVEKAKERGFEVHVVGNSVIDQIRTIADKVHNFSSLDTDKIVEIGKPAAVCSVAVDLAVPVIAKLNEHWNLIGNSVESAKLSTDKYLMKTAFLNAGIPCAKAIITEYHRDYEPPFTYPLIVKPVDRSGSRGVSKVYHPELLDAALKRATAESFVGKAVIEEFIPGQEYSAEGLSWDGEHTILQVTEKYTAEHFVEAMHIQPAELRPETRERIVRVLKRALTALRVKWGASHSEFKITSEGELKIIEIGARMGAEAVDKMVAITTGFDFVGAVLDTALGIMPVIKLNETGLFGVSKFVFNKEDLDNMPSEVVDVSPMESFDGRVVASNEARYGHYVFSCREKYKAVGINPHTIY